LKDSDRHQGALDAIASISSMIIDVNNISAGVER